MVRTDRFEEAAALLSQAAGPAPYPQQRLVARALYAVARWRMGAKDEGMKIARETLQGFKDPSYNGARDALKGWIAEHTDES